VNGKSIEPGVVGGEPPHGFHLDVRTRGFNLTDGIHQHVVDHVAAKVAKHARVISSLTVRLQDVNGPKGGPDKCCRIELLISGVGPIIIEETHQDTYAAIDAAGVRLVAAVHRELEQRRSRQRQRGHKIVRNRKLLH